MKAIVIHSTNNKTASSGRNETVLIYHYPLNQSQDVGRDEGPPVDITLKPSRWFPDERKPSSH